MSELPNIEDEQVQSQPNIPDIPDIDDEIKQRWSHDALVTATMTAQQTQTMKGRPQLEITLISEGGARQKFWARIGEPRSNWVLSRFLLPYVNEVKKAMNKSSYDFGTELMESTLTQYLESNWVQDKMKAGIEVRCVTTVRNSSSQNSNRTVSLEFVHHNDDGSEGAFESIKNLKQSDALNRAKSINQNTQVSDPF